MSKTGSAIKRLTKKQAYAKHGITFDGKYIHSPVGKIKEFLKEGNTKTGKRVYTFSTLAGTDEYTVEINGKVFTVKGTCVCDCNGCYAKTGHYNHDNVKRSLAINTYLVNEHIDFVKACISAQLEFIGACEVRIHAAGDFNTKHPDEYMEMWESIVEENNTCEFWTYTKVKRFEDRFDKFENANIVKSVIPHIGVNFGKAEYIINAYYALVNVGADVYICKCGIDENQHCEGCKVCTNYKYVLFVEHSTGYNVKKDPLYSKLTRIINSQKAA